MTGHLLFGCGWKPRYETYPENLIGHLADWLTWKRLIFSIVMIFFLTGILFPFLLDGQLFI